MASFLLGVVVVIHSFTPSGVEHLATPAQNNALYSCDSFVYAVRR